MKIKQIVGGFQFLIVALTAVTHAHSADDKLFLDLATREESWLEWKNIPQKMSLFKERVDSGHARTLTALPK